MTSSGPNAKKVRVRPDNIIDPAESTNSVSTHFNTSKGANQKPML